MIHQSQKMRASMIQALNLKRHGHPELDLLPVVKLPRIDHLLGSPPVTGTWLLCDGCDRIYTSINELQLHQRICNRILKKPHRCGYCGLSFTTIGGLRVHQSSHTRLRPHSCNKCQSCFTTLDRLKEHQKRHMVSQAQSASCGRCELQFISQKGLSIHSAHCGRKRERLYPCDQCDANFLTLAELCEHQARHTRLMEPFYQDPARAIPVKQEEPEDVPCSIPNIKKEEAEVCQDLTTHQKMPMDYTCDLCGSDFAKLKYLYRHNISFHREARSYSCDHCALRFLALPGLHKHQARFNHFYQDPAGAISVEQEEPVDGQDLATHKKMHLRKQHHSCDLCGLKFTRCTDLYRHNGVHSGERSYCCDQCGLKFATVQRLVVHYDVHSGGNKSYSCAHCVFDFLTISGLRAHQAMHARSKPSYQDPARPISIGQEETEVCLDFGEPGVMEEDYSQPVEDSEESGEEPMESSGDSESSSEDSESSSGDSESSSEDSESSSEDSEGAGEDSEEPWKDSDEPWGVFVGPGQLGEEPGEVSASEYLISKNRTAPAHEQSLSVADVLLRDDTNCVLYTGIPLKEFYTLVSWLNASAPTPSTIPVKDQILLTLMTLRQNFMVADLARRFTWSPDQVCESLNFWIDEIAEQTKELFPWLPCETMEATMPQLCQGDFPNTTCIIECTESVLQKPINGDAGTESYSHYYANNNVKYLVATASSGMILFISKAYGGKCSDRLIAQNSGFLDHLRAGDVVIGHHGLSIGDLLEERNVRLVLPACTQKQCHLINNEVTRHVANECIPVERAINRLKMYRILSQTVPLHLVPKIDNILKVCAALVNLRGEPMPSRLTTKRP